MITALMIRVTIITGLKIAATIINGTDNWSTND